ncbi:CcdB family protein [Oceanicoccus sagamiensis]|uniref:Toxin CcdB n=1 Tax=Oceanicoccus sagamiensis TaxID=716816 RepID=A0A1X9NEP9_9GAMM|nr:CcdB family protein [Oceanicoccus sagamiensis]ARN74029.1 plasmid maintenance protein CcdB [Oceanicoccus sagamiensis]
MAQFDVYTNPSSKTRNAYPYIIDIQSPLIANISTRIVIPLGRLKDFRQENMRGPTPEISYLEEPYLLLTPQIASMPTKLLKQPIGSLSHFREEIISAIDFAITGI